jgi:biopolymer transport protein ExbD
MGMNIGRSGGIQREINVTPLVDVVLVLLIIFLVTMPIVMRQTPVEIPPKVGDMVPVTTPVEVLVRADLSVEIDDGGRRVTVQAVELARALRPIVDARRSETPIFVDFEDGVSWSDSVATMDTVRSMGHGGPGVRLALRTHDEAR